MFERNTEYLHDYEGTFADEETVRRYSEKSEEHIGQMYGGFLKQLAPLNRGESWLDVGAGPGILTASVAQQYPRAQITALEPSEPMVAFGKTHVAEKELQDRISFVVGGADNEAVLETTGPFDLIYSCYTLHFFHDPERCIHNLLGRLNEGGTLFFYDIQRAWWLAWVPLHNAFFRSLRAAYVLPEVREIMQRAGIATYDLKPVFPFMFSLVINK
jgi:ubiquinone/menaquinone biosynthesis C-methylase UbiE